VTVQINSSLVIVVHFGIRVMTGKLEAPVPSQSKFCLW